MDYEIAYYRPRIEGLFSRIERWRATQTGVVHWRTITRDNVVTIFGDSAESRVADPTDASHIFEWRISRTFDDKGNASFYVYGHEDGAGLSLASAHEANRTPEARKTQTYLHKVLYGNRTPYFVDFTAAAEPAAPAAADWMFAVSLDYGDHRDDRVDPRRDLDLADRIPSRSIDPVSRSALIAAFSVCCSSTIFPARPASAPMVWCARSI